MKPRFWLFAALAVTGGCHTHEAVREPLALARVDAVYVEVRPSVLVRESLAPHADGRRFVSARLDAAAGGGLRTARVGEGLLVRPGDRVLLESLPGERETDSIEGRSAEALVATVVAPRTDGLARR